MHNLRNLGLMMNRVVAPSARSTTEPTIAQHSHAIKLLASFLNMEDSARQLESTPHFSSMLRADLKAVRKAAETFNLRMMREGHESITKAIDTLNARSNILNQVSLLLANAPTEIALAAMKAAADMVEQMRYPPKQRPARRVKSLTIK